MTHQPDILLILANRHRRDYTGFGGSHLVQTPNIDAFAAQGIWFDNAATVFPQAPQSRASILTGRYPDVTPKEMQLSESPLGLAVQAAGYHLVEINAQNDLATTADQAIQSFSASDVPRFTVVNLPELNGEIDDLPEEVLEPYRGNGIPLAIHHAAATHCDLAVGRILAGLKNSGRADQTAVIYTSIVGDQFKFRDAVNLGGYTCYNDCIRVPLIMQLPERPAGIQRSQIVGLHDLAPTIAAIARAKLDGAQGKNLLELVANPKVDWRDALYLFNQHLKHIDVTFTEGKAYFGTFPPWEQRALWNGRFKLILSFDNGRHSLFDTLIDPEEEFDLYGAPYRRTPMDELTRFKDTMPTLLALADQMKQIADDIGDDAGAGLAQSILTSVDPLHRPMGTPFFSL